ncbi:Asp-tRNA(Asn)/Glu-tRNA(Gln) amidotransferase subunit GatC [Candidatus Azambacteria bacterium]|nr:Asp-tRNA(Asn)/Glu-tRNA(Gln) amidotransferase subunit GatC [Candidatus Azambacteria bacterium]
MLTIDQVKHLAKLARLELAEEELTTFVKELSSILDYFEKLKEIDIENILPTAYALDVKNVFREDQPSQKCDEEMITQMLQQAPGKDGRYVKVKAVL